MPGSTGRVEGSKDPKTLDLIITRVFDAPRNLVFQTWIDPEHIRRWSAPHGFELTHCEGDARPGGSWRCCMRAPDGRELWLGGVYRRIVENELIEQTHVWDEDGVETLIVVRFEDEGKKTRMIFRQTGFDSVVSRDSHQGGWTECFERLDTLLRSMSQTTGPRGT